MNDIDVMPLLDVLYQQREIVRVSYTSFQIDDPQWIWLPYKLNIYSTYCYVMEEECSYVDNSICEKWNKAHIKKQACNKGQINMCEHRTASIINT
jgi:hypothetical protein